MNFFVVIIMGTLIGLAIAFVLYFIHRHLITSSNVEIVLTLVSPYLMYYFAEYFHFSGVLAVVSGGLFYRADDSPCLPIEAGCRELMFG